MNVFEVKAVQNELQNMKSFADIAIRVIDELQDEIDTLRVALNGKASERKSSCISVSEIAADMGISKQTTINYINAGRIKGRKEGRKWIILYSDYLRFRNNSNE
jgi:predicted DNA-binding protein (UPF0251 family)